MATTFLGLATLGLIAGCGLGDDLPDRAPVRGTVLLNGEPLPGAMVTFHPQNDAGNRGQASTDDQGRYVLSTYATEDGAVVGEHTVTVERYIMPMPKNPGERMPNAGSSVPTVYTRPETSPLKVEVKSNTRNTIDLELQDM